MVQEYVSPVRVHKYPFEMVMAAYEMRFPSCPQIPVVIECVITEDSWTPDDSQRDTTRRCQLNVEAPYLLKKMIGVDYVYFIQKNHLDLKSRILEIEATNETFAARVSVVEKCRYYVHPENPEWTCFEQSALLDVTNFFGFENTVEKIAMKQYAANIAKGKELIEVFMMEVNAGGVSDLRPWSASEPARNRELRRVVSRGTEPLSPRPAAEAKKHSIPGTSQTGTQSLPAISRQSQIDAQAFPDISRPGQETQAQDRPRRGSNGWNSLTLQRSTQQMPRPRSKSDLNTRELQDMKFKHSDPSSGPSVHTPRSKSRQRFDNDSSALEGKKSGILRSLSFNRTKSKQRLDERSSSPSIGGRRNVLSSLNLKRNKSKQRVDPTLTMSTSEESEKKIEETISLARQRSLVLRDTDRISLGKTDFTTRDLDIKLKKGTVRPCECDPFVTESVIAGYITRWDNLVIVLLCVMVLVLALSSPLSFFWRRPDRGS